MAHTVSFRGKKYKVWDLFLYVCAVGGLAVALEGRLVEVPKLKERQTIVEKQPGKVGPRGPRGFSGVDGQPGERRLIVRREIRGPDGRLLSQPRTRIIERGPQGTTGAEGARGPQGPRGEPGINAPVPDPAPPGGSGNPLPPLPPIPKLPPELCLIHGTPLC